MIVYRNFEGDIRQPPGQAAHGVTFKEATTVFSAEDLVVSEDPASGELRAIGTSARGRKLVVLHRRGLRIRILDVALYGEGGDDSSVPQLGTTVADDAGTAASIASAPSATGTSKAETTEVLTTDGKGTERASTTRAGIVEVGATKTNAGRTSEIVERVPEDGARESIAARTNKRSSTSAPEQSATGGAEPLPADAEPRAVAQRMTGPIAKVADPIATSSTRAATKPASTARRRAHDDAPVADRTAGTETSEATAPRRRGRPRRAPSALQLSIDDVLSKAAARELEHVTPTAIEDDGAPTIAADPRRVEPAHEGRRGDRKRVASDPIVAAAPPTIVTTTPAKNGEQTNGWTAETYDVYWKAYTTARDEARRGGKSTREAQRLGREAGERAAAKHREPPPKRSSRSSSWRAAARAVKLDR